MKANRTITTIFFLVFALVTKAQDKYEFMIIEYDQYDREIVIAIDGNKILKESTKVDNNERYSGDPLLKRVSAYQNQGWEVMHFETSTVNAFHYYHAFLRKKKVESK